MFHLPLRKSHVRTFLLYSLYVLSFAVAVSAIMASAKSDGSGSGSVSKADRQAEAEKRRQAKRMYSLFDHIIRIVVITFLSAVFAGLTLGVMCADTFTLEIIAESGPAPDCKYAAQVLPLRKQGHKTLCTLIVSNMLCNTLIVQEFSSMFDIIYAIRTHGNTNNVVDDSGSQLLNFIVSTTVIVIFAEILPMSICKSKYSLKVAAAGSIFVKVAMVITYPVSAPLGKFLDWIVGTEETGQVYDRKELRKLMMIHYDHERGNGDMPKTELNLLLAAMDFQECKVKDIMTPIEKVTHVREDDVITPDFVERLWLSGRSRVPVQAARGMYLCDVLVVKDLLTVNIGPDEEPLTVAQVVKARNRLFAMVGENTTLPAMMKFFQDAKTHMAVVFAEEQDAEPVAAAVEDNEEVSASKDGESAGGRHGVPAVTLNGEDSATTPPTDFPSSSTARRSFAKTFAPAATPGVRSVGIVTMEDVVEELLNDEIYDEYDRYEPEEVVARDSPTIKVKQAPHTTNSYPRTEELRVPAEPTKPPRVNFYSYFTHPESDTPLSEAQVWAVAYFLSRTVKAFMLWPPAYIKVLLDDCGDEQLVAPMARRGTTGGDGAGTAGSNGSTGPSTPPAPTAAPGGANPEKSVNSSRGTNDTQSTLEAANVVAVPPIDLRSEHTLESSTALSVGGRPGLGDGPGSIDSPTTRRMQRFDHAHFTAQAPSAAFVMYAIGSPSEHFTLVLGGQVDMLVGSDKFYSRLRSFQFIGEEALTNTFYAPDFSAIVSRAARVYRIPKEKYECYLSYQTVRQRLHSHLRVLRTPHSAINLASLGTTGGAASPLAPTRSRRAGGSAAQSRSTSRSPYAYMMEPSATGQERDSLLRRTFSETAVDDANSPKGKAYGTFRQEKY